MTQSLSKNLSRIHIQKIHILLLMCGLAFVVLMTAFLVGFQVGMMAEKHRLRKALSVLSNSAALPLPVALREAGPGEIPAPGLQGFPPVSVPCNWKQGVTDPDEFSLSGSFYSCRVEQQLARLAHNQEVAGANPAPATIFLQEIDICLSFKDEPDLRSACVAYMAAFALRSISAEVQP